MSSVATPTPCTTRVEAQSASVCLFVSNASAARSIAGEQTSVYRVVLGAQAEDGWEALDSYLRADWEYRLIANFELAARSWHKRNGGEELFGVDGLDIADAGRFSFLTRVVLEKGRTLAALSDALDALSPAEVYCDAALAPYLRVLYDGPLHLCNRTANSSAIPSEKTGFDAPGWRTILRELLLGAGYKLGCAFGLSRWMQWRKGDGLPTSAPLFVGSEHGLKNLEPFLAELKRPINVLRPVGQLRRNCGLANAAIHWRITYLESLLSARDCLRVAWRSMRIAMWFRSTSRKNGFRKLFEWNGRDCLSLFAPEFLRFVVAHSMGAFRNHYIAKNLIPKNLIPQHRPARVFFDNANAWEFSVMVEHLRRAGIPTVGFVNGLVQDIIPFRCAVDTLLTGGVWDQQLLAPVMEDTNVVAYGTPMPSASSTRGNNLLLISSSCRDHANRRAFARVVAEYIENSVPEDEFAEIVLKLHPYEDAAAMRSYFAEFPRAAARIRITRLGLEAEIAHARVAICLLSTVIRDLAWQGVPFLLFDSIEWPQHTFYSQVPSSIKFTSAPELARKAADVQSLRAESLRVRELYFGAPPPNASALLRHHLLGECDG